MKHRYLILWCVVAVVLSSCVSELTPVDMPVIDYAAELAGTDPLTEGSRPSIVSGVYVVEIGRGRLGDTVAVRFDGRRLGIYAERNVTFVGAVGASRGDSAIVIGTWRAITNQDAGRVDLAISAGEGGRDLVQGKGNGKGLILRGTVRVGSTTDRLVLRKLGAIKARLRGFQIIAHRGGGRNSERLGRSENSIPMMLLASSLGATGIEIDVHATKDGVPIVFHDPTFTARTVPSPYMIGDVNNYSLSQMRIAARMVYGEQIPTLREALSAVIDSTELTLVWLDVKNASVVDSILQIQREMIDYGTRKGRKLQILFGIPSSDILQAYEASPFVGSVPVLCELDPTTARRIKAAVWAPRFTLGTQETIVRELQRDGCDVYVWTLDDAAFIRRYIAADLFDGVLTNYPTLLAWGFYTRQIEP
jgi:glycerophosphoryl diester phosphodiesterase